MNIQDLKPGDKVIRKMPGFRSDFWRFDGEAAEVTETTITAIVNVDVPRRMIFDRITGRNVHGDDFGWLEPVTN